ncbi:MAG: tetratricopeptide repeat protein [Spirochaetaceae bacterium]|jgi:tetratricopeptide (TPR) repeat protein|nr:tetratricopeptide repeat protein [Spirochaetaceae bacterium]
MESENTVVKLEEPHSLAGFIQQRRNFFIGLLVFVIAAIVVFFVIAGVQDANTKKKLTALEDLIERYEKLADSIEEEPSGTEVETLRFDLQTFAEGARGYAGAKAWSLAGTVYSKQGKWADAENAFMQSAESGKKTHLYGPSLFNAGIAAEEANNIDKAIEYYTRSVGVPGTIIGARAQFSIGRLQEGKGDRDAARLAYRNVIDQYTDYSGDTWREFAQSRLIALDEGN